MTTDLTRTNLLLLEQAGKTVSLNYCKYINDILFV
jgi:hypothetical protein